MDGLGTGTSGPWWVVWQGAATPVVIGVWAAWRWWKERDDKIHGETLSREERLMRDIDAQRASAAKDASDLFARTKDELVRRDLETQRKDARIDVLERDLDTWIDRARGWQRRAHAVVHKLNNVRQAFNAGRVRAGLREIPWSNETLPPMEEISASNETYFNRDPSGSWVDPDAST